MRDKNFRYVDEINKLLDKVDDNISYTEQKISIPDLQELNVRLEAVKRHAENVADRAIGAARHLHANIRHSYESDGEDFSQ